MKLRRICESLKPSVRTAGTPAASSKCSSTPGWAGRRVTTARSVANSSGTSTSDSRTIVRPAASLARSRWSLTSSSASTIAPSMSVTSWRIPSLRSSSWSRRIASVIPRTAYSGVRSSCVSEDRKLALASARRRSSAGLDLELGVQRGDRAVGVAELGVEVRELLLALAQRRERGEQLEVLLAQLVEDPRAAAAGVMAGQRREDELELVDAGHPRVRAGVGAEADDGAPLTSRASTRSTSRPRASRSRRGPSAVTVRTERGTPETVIRTATDGGASTTASSTSPFGSASRATSQTAVGQPDLLGRAELQQRRQIAGAPPRQQHVLLRAQFEREDGPRHRTER